MKALLGGPVAEETHGSGTDATACLLRHRAGDPEALGALYDALAPGTLRFLRALRTGLDAGALEDALQESFLRLVDKLPDLQDPRRVRGYALGIARNVALDLVRRARFAGSTPREEEPLAPPAESGLLRAERQEIVSASLAALPTELHEALALRHLTGISLAELADALDCSVPTARARLREAASRLALELRRRGLDPREEVR